MITIQYLQYNSISHTWVHDKETNYADIVDFNRPLLPITCNSHSGIKKYKPVLVNVLILLKVIVFGYCLLRCF